jgi:hypothetical protein
MTDWPRIGSLNPEDQWRQFLALNPGLTLRQGHGMSSP